MARDNAVFSRCPYTLKSHEEIEVSQEHIVPDALGGPSAYSVRADRGHNSTLGHTVDSELIHSPSVAGLRLMHGVAPSGRTPVWKMRGTIEGSDTRVEVTFQATGADQRVLNPVQWSDDRKSVVITESAEKLDSFVKNFTEGQARKGKKLKIGGESGSKLPRMSVEIAIDTMVIRQALLKVAYLGVYEYLGDAFLDDPLNPEWRRVVLAKRREAVESAQLHGVVFDPGLCLDLMMPPLADYEHGVSIANLNIGGVVVGVRLFGKGFHCAIVRASETNSYGLKPFEGEIVIIDARNQSLRRARFEEHFFKAAASLPFQLATVVPSS